jgi:glucokinase
MTFVLAIDIGGTNTKLALVDPVGKVGEVVSIPTTGKLGSDSYLQKVLDAGTGLTSTKKAEVEGVGIGVAGFIDPNHTRMTYNPNIAWLEGALLTDYFSTRLNLPVNLEVDSNAAALAEAVHGNGKNCQRLLVLTIGTGLGGGMIVEGEILRIANECLGDIGHVIVEPGGPQCASGCHGCAEAMVSASALEKYAIEAMANDIQATREKRLKNGETIHTPEIIKAAQQGDKASRKAIQKLGKYLGIALASIAPVLAPDGIRIAGGVSEAGPILMEAAQSSFLEIAGPPYTEGLTIQKALLGWQSVLVGAAEAQRRINIGSGVPWVRNDIPC